MLSYFFLYEILYFSQITLDENDRSALTTKNRAIISNQHDDESNIDEIIDSTSHVNKSAAHSIFQENKNELTIIPEFQNFQALDKPIHGSRRSSIQYSKQHRKQSFISTCDSVKPVSDQPDKGKLEHKSYNQSSAVLSAHPDIDNGWAWVVVGSCFCAFSTITGECMIWWVVECVFRCGYVLRACGVSLYRCICLCGVFTCV